MEAPEFYDATAFCSSQFPSEKHHSLDSKQSADHFIVDDLLVDFSNDDAVLTDACGSGVGGDVVTGDNSTDSSTVTVIDSSCNSSSFSGCDPGFHCDIGSHGAFPDSHFAGVVDLPVPCDDLAELEWLSNFVEESFSSEEDLQKLHLISGIKARPDDNNSHHHQENTAAANSSCNSNINTNDNHPIFHHETTVPAKARSKRSRAAPCNWTSRLLVLSSATTTLPSEATTICDLNPCLQVTHQHSNSGKKKTAKPSAPKKREGGGEGGGIGDGRKCLHCATDKTPQWRTGPMGPKTLCNACGVRYKSGRLVPEYRPAASPTFVLTKHSNSHRKVMEIRRQKEMTRAQSHHQPPPPPPQQQYLAPPPHHINHRNVVFDHLASNGDDYLIHQHVGPDFRQLMI